MLPWPSFGQSQELYFEEEPVEPTLEEQFISSNIYISEWFDGTAEGLDLFLSGKEISKQKNGSHLRVENSTFSVEGENLKNTTSLSVILRLPNLEEYWQLKFSSYDDVDEKRDIRKGQVPTGARERNYGASVGLFRKFGRVRTAFQPRIEISDPLKISHSLAFESIADFKTYVINPKFELFATPTKGTGFYLAANVNFPLTPKWSFTLINTGEYEDKKHQYSSGNGFSFGQSVDAKTSMSYSLIFNCNNRDNYHLESYGLSVAWSHSIYKRILDAQVVPHLDFGKERTFKGVAGIVLSLNLNF